MNTITAVAEHLNIDKNLVMGLNKRLKEGLHFEKKKHPDFKNTLKFYSYSDAGISKLKASLEELKHLKPKINKLFTDYSGCNSNESRKHKAIIVKTGIAVALREKGFSKYEIAFLLDKHRSTLYNTFSNYDNKSFSNWDMQDIEEYKNITIKLIK